MVAQGVKLAAAVAMPRRQREAQAQPTQQEHADLRTGDGDLVVRRQHVEGTRGVRASLRQPQRSGRGRQVGKVRLESALMAGKGRMPLPSTQVIGGLIAAAEAQPDQRRFPRPGLQSLAHVGKFLRSQRWSLLSLGGAQGLQDALRDLKCAVTNNRERVAPGGPMCRMAVGPRAAQAKSPKPRRKLGCTCGVFRQRGVRIAEKPGQAPRDSSVVTSGVFFAERGGQHAQQVICPRRSAVAQQ